MTHRDNRLAPLAIIFICITFAIYLLNPSFRNYRSNVDSILKATSQGEPPYPGTSLEDARHDLPLPSEPDLNSIMETASRLAVNQVKIDDILLIMKTGGTTMWKRLLIHLSTSFSRDRVSPSNLAIYSDQSAQIGPFHVVDVLVNMSVDAKKSSEFDVYHRQVEYNDFNYYVEASGVPGDDPGPTGGWIIDKYKFLPLMDHAGRNWPKVKWYIYMEDDAYLFLPEVRHYLSKFDWREKHYLGSYAFKSNVSFAHGGAGFALSRGAWEASFGSNKDIIDEYADYTSTHCCGDQVLGKFLVEHGIKFGEDGSGKDFRWGFNGIVHWAFAFSRSNWCAPLLSWHKTHSRDVAEYFTLERAWDFSKPLLHKDFFNSMILPRITSSIDWWDNMASAYEVSSGKNILAIAAPNGDRHDAETWTDAWHSKEACEAACKKWEDCMMWSFVDDLCKMDDKITLGQGYAPAMWQRKTSLKHTSGWITERLADWQCH